MQQRTPVLHLSLLAAALLAAGPSLAADATSSVASASAAESSIEDSSAEQSTAAPGHRADVAEAERLAEAAFAAYQQQDYERAIQLYQQAWSAAPSADISFNIARVYDRGLHDARRASEYYQRYIDDPKALPHRRRSAEQRLAELQVTLASEPAAVPAATAAPVGAAAPPPTVVEPSSSWTPRSVTALVLGGTGVSALGVGLGFALSAHGERSEWQRGCDGNACTSQRAVDAARSAGRKADIATVALASGVGLLGIGATLWWLSPSAPESAPRAQLRVIPSGHATDLSCTLSGRF